MFFLSYNGIPQETFQATLRCMSLSASCISLAYGILSIELRGKLAREPTLMELLHYGLTELTFKIVIGSSILKLFNTVVSYNKMYLFSIFPAILLIGMAISMIFLCCHLIPFAIICLLEKLCSAQCWNHKTDHSEITTSDMIFESMCGEKFCTFLNYIFKITARDKRMEFLENRKRNILLQLLGYLIFLVVFIIQLKALNFFSDNDKIAFSEQDSTRYQLLLHIFIVCNALFFIQNITELLYIYSTNKCFIDWIYNLLMKDNPELVDMLIVGMNGCCCCCCTNGDNVSLKTLEEGKQASNVVDGNKDSNIDDEETQALLLQEGTAENSGMTEVIIELTSVLIHPESSRNMDEIEANWLDEEGNNTLFDEFIEPKDTITEESKKVTTTEDSKEVTTTEDSKEVTTTEDSKENTTTEDSKEVTTTEDSKENTTTENSKEVTTIEVSKENTTTEDSKEVTTTEDNKEVTTTEDSKEVTTTEDSKEVTTTEDSKEVTTTEGSQEVTTTKKNQQATSEESHSIIQNF